MRYELGKSVVPTPSNTVTRPLIFMFTGQILILIRVVQLLTLLPPPKIPSLSVVNDLRVLSGTTPDLSTLRGLIHREGTKEIRRSLCQKVES